jgi:hypothetical protein
LTRFLGLTGFNGSRTHYRDPARPSRCIRRLRRTLRPVSRPLGFGWRLFWMGLLLGATLLGCLFLMAKATGS